MTARRPAPARLAEARALLDKAMLDKATLDKATLDTERLARSPGAVSARVPTLPVAAALVGSLPAGGLPKGATVSAGGSVALLFALLAEASARGSWCALVGLPEIGLVAAHEAGIELRRLALVPAPGEQLRAVVSALLEGVDIVVLGQGRLSAGDRQRLAAKARRSGAVLIAHAIPWPGADLCLTLEPGACRWEGLVGGGMGRLRARRAVVRVGGRGVAARSGTATVMLPGPDGTVCRPEPQAPTVRPADPLPRRHVG